MSSVSRSRFPRLRPWQERALEALDAVSEPDFLAVATPGAGKTTFALTAVARAIDAGRAKRLIVVAPTQHLKTQWTDAAAGFGLVLEPEWSPSRRGWPRDAHGLVTTYQQVAGNAARMRALARGAFAVLDEIHHAGDARAWGDGIRTALEPAARRLGLSGTPFRSDDAPIPFVRYRRGLAEPDFEYSYGDALGDGGVVRPVYFPRIDGEMEWTAPGGMRHRHTFRDAVGRVLANQRMRTALSLRGEWLPAVLDRAHAQLETFRRADGRAGGIVIAMDQGHARGIARWLRGRFGVEPALAISDEPAASAAISRYAKGSDPWIVAVRMVSEGVDVPRLRVGVYATNTTTDLFFRQAVGRLVRWTRGLVRQPACMFIPDDSRLRTWAAEIRDQRRHSLAKRVGEADGFDGAEAARPARAVDSDGQISLFSPISAVALGVEGLPGEVEDAPAFPVGSPGPAPASADGAEVDAGDTPGAVGWSRRELRELNAERARLLSRRAGVDHARVHAELNRRAGIRSVSEASEGDLRRRLEAAERWLRELARPGLAP